MAYLKRKLQRVYFAALGEVRQIHSWVLQVNASRSAVPADPTQGRLEEGVLLRRRFRASPE
jgi:hypothetical protein